MVLVRKSTEREEGTTLGKAPDWSGETTLTLTACGLKAGHYQRPGLHVAISVDEMIFRKRQSEAIDCPGT